MRTTTSIREALTFARQHKRVLILGPSASGKSFLASKLGGFNLDKVGYRQGNNWLIDLSKVPDGYNVYEGSFKNIPDILSLLEPHGFIFVRPEINLYMKLNGLKYASYTGSNEVWRQGWLNKSRDKADAQSYLDSRMKEIINSVAPAAGRGLIFFNATLENEPMKGWHES